MDAPCGDTVLAQAIDRSQLFFLYQPVFTAAGNLAGAEAFLRWQHPRCGVLRPGAFLDSADASLLATLTVWTVAEAAQQLVVWRRQGFAPGRLSINVPAAVLTPAFAAGVIEHLYLEGIEPGTLAFEISDALPLPVSGTLPMVLGELASAGVGCLLDDFGRGDTLMDAARMPLAGLKLDAMLSAGLPDGRREAGFVRALASVGRALGVPVGAKHIETAAQRRFYLDAGIENLQGDGLAPAMTAEEFQAQFDQDMGAGFLGGPLR